MGLTAAGYIVDTSDAMRFAQQWILSTRGRAGGFATAPGFDPDPCNTARAVRALLQMRAYGPDHPVIRSAMGYLKRSQPTGAVWATTTESFVVEGGSGEVTFTRNTPADALEALVLADPDCRETGELVAWFMASQEFDGSWRLHRPDNHHRQRVNTWSTSAAIRALSRYEQHLAGRQMPRRTSRVRNVAVIALSIGLTIETVLLLRVSAPLLRFWDAVPAWLQLLAIGFTMVVTGSVVTYASAAMAVRRFRREQ
jgi:hypothetical protein